MGRDTYGVRPLFKLLTDDGFLAVCSEAKGNGILFFIPPWIRCFAPFFFLLHCLTCFSDRRPHRNYPCNGHPRQHHPLSTRPLWGLWFEAERQSAIYSDGAVSLLHQRASSCHLWHCGETTNKYETVLITLFISLVGKHFLCHLFKWMSPQVLTRKRWKATSEPCSRMQWGSVSWLTGELVVFCQVIYNSATYSMYWNSACSCLLHQTV